MSPACIAQLLGSAMSFSRSAFAHAAAGAAATTATVNAWCNHALPTLFIRPPPVNREIARPGAEFRPTLEQSQFVPYKRLLAHGTEPSMLRRNKSFTNIQLIELR